MKITDLLLGEHGLFSPLLEQVETLADKAETRDEIALAVELVRPAIESHALIEDELLFPALESQGFAPTPILVMRAEHREIERLIYGIPNAPDVDAARQGLLNLLELLSNHFRKEEQVLFPLAESILSEQQQHELSERWRGRRGV